MQAAVACQVAVACQQLYMACVACQIYCHSQLFYLYQLYTHELQFLMNQYLLLYLQCATSTCRGAFPRLSSSYV